MTHGIANRTQVILSSVLAMAAAMWLLVSPWALQFTGSDSAASNDIVFACIILMLAGTRGFAAFQAAWLGWLVALMGLWILVSPWVLGYAYRPTELWNNVGTGALILLLAVWSSLATVLSTPQALMASVETEYHDQSQLHRPIA